MSKVKFAPLATFADVTMGQSPGSELYNTEGKGLPFLQGCAEFGARNPQPTIYCNPPLRVAETGSVLISVRAPVGTMNYAEQAYCIGRGLAAFKAKRDVSNSIFLKHAVEQNESYLHRRSQGSTFAAVSADDIKSVPVPAFDLPTQNKVAHVFETIDGAIEKTEALFEKYQQIKAGMMHDLFTRGIGADGKLRPPREQAPELYQQTPIGWLPNEWKCAILTDLTYQIVDGTHFTPRYVEHGVPFLRVTDIQSGEIDFGSVKYVSHAEHEDLSKRCAPKRGDVLLSKNGTVGIAKVVDWDWEFSIFVSLCLIKPKESILPNYLGSLFACDLIWQQIRRRAKQGTVNNLHLEEIRELFVPLPCKSEQAAIMGAVSTLDARISNEETRLKELQKLKSGLMHDLLTGESPVKVAAEPVKAEAHV